MTTQASLPTNTVFTPKDLSLFGKKQKLPVIAWGNGACFNSPFEHVKDRSKSTQLPDAIDWGIAQNADKKSPYYQKIDVSRIAVSGMSCGGLQTLGVSSDPLVVANLPKWPRTGTIGS